MKLGAVIIETGKAQAAPKSTRTAPITARSRKPGCLKRNTSARSQEKSARNRSLTEEQQASSQKSRTRARVEHVFGAMTNGMGGIRTIGSARAHVQIGLMNLAGIQHPARGAADPQKYWGFDRVIAPAAG